MFIVRKSLLIIALVLLTLPLGIPMAAQDATPEPEATAVAPSDTEITVEDGGVVNIEATDTPSDTVPTLINIAIVFAGAIVAGGSFAVIWDRIRRSKEAKDSIERLAEGLSPEWRGTIDKILDIAEATNRRAAEVLEFAREVTDQKPNLPPTG